MKVALTVYLKELADALRDRRTWMVVLISSIVAGPVSLLLLASFVSDIEASAAKREVLVAGGQHAPQLNNFLARAGARVSEAPADFRERQRDGRLQQAVIVVPEDFERRLARGEDARLQLVFDDSGTKAQASSRAAAGLLRAWQRELASQGLMARGVSPQLLTSFSVEEVNLAPSRSRGAQLLFLVPWLAMLGSVVGAISVAIDVTAGERERGSLEPLLMNPVPAWAVVLGKWGVVATSAVAVVLLTLAGFALAMQFVRSETLAALMQFGPRELAVFLAVLLPFAGFMAALLMLAAAYGRSYKEAQTYASYITMLVNFLPILPLFLSLRDAPWQLAVPALGQQMVLARVLRGEAVGWPELMAPGALALAGTLVCLALLARLLRAERIVFAR
jgi:sodium transport system permease protein